MATSYDGQPPFPEDLATEVLKRLPVESLLRFKCVNKDWSKTISSYSFMREHLNWSDKNKPSNILVYDHTSSPPPPEFLHSYDGMMYLLGSVDGLFLIERVIKSVYNVWLAIWNPATREVRPLPEPDFDLQQGLRELDGKFGFGLDPVTDDYKVVWFRSFWDDIADRQVYRTFAAVYSCRRDSWRTLKPENEQTFLHKHFREALGCAYVNGAYYWLVSGGIGKSCIVSFDFGDEVFGEIEGPDVYPWFERLILFDGDVAVLTAADRFYYDIWVMIQPGVWNKLYSFQCYAHVSQIKSWSNCTTLIFTNNVSRLVSYDVRTKKTKRLGFSRPDLKKSYMEGGYSVHSYKESLITIRRRNDLTGELDQCNLPEMFDSFTIL